MSKYIHLLRAMHAGDVLYLPEILPRLDRQIASAVGRYDGQAETACFVAVNLEPSTAHRVVKITMLKPMRAVYRRGRKLKPEGVK